MTDCFRCDAEPAAPGRLLCPRCQKISDEQDRRGKLTPAERAYEDAHGRDALERQRAEAAERHVCCGELVADGHHEACPKWRPTVHPAQEQFA